VIAVVFVTHTPEPLPPTSSAPVVELIPATSRPVDDTVAVEFLSSEQLPTEQSPVPPPLPAISTGTRSMTEVGHPASPASTAEPIATTTEPGTAEPTTSEPSGPSRNRYLDMRRNQVDLHLPGHDFDNSDWVPKGTDAQQPIESGRLKQNGAGFQSHEGQVIATVAPDGTVKLGSQKNFHAHVALPSAHELGDVLQAWYYDPNKPVGTLAPEHPPEDLQMGNGEVVSVPAHGPAVEIPGAHGPSKISDDGTVPILGGSFDVTDAFMRRHGQDPYASAKLAYLDSTRDERVQIGLKHKSEQLSHVAELMQKNLVRAWSIPDLAARKQALFEMWDECIEGGGAEEMQAASTQARNLVVAFIRSRLPAGSANAFTASELIAFNRTKQSKAAFSPYE
jgi:hypothetical protein